MKELNADFILEKNKAVVKPIRLYTIFDYDNNGANLYFAEYDQDVTFDSQVYTAFPLSFDSISEKTGGEVDEIRVSIANVSREIEAYLQNPNYTFKGKKVVITYIFADQMDNPDAKYEEIFYIDLYESNETNVTFTLSSKLDVYQVKLPRRTVTRTHCSWVFKGIECKYAGTETACSRTLQRCRGLGNTVNFGGFPAAGGKRMFA